MIINPISQLAQMIAALRKQIQKTRAHSSSSTKSNQSSSHLEMISEKQKKHELKQVEAKLIEQISKLDMSKDSEFQQGVHAFVQEILLWEFGEKISEDPHFTQMIDDMLNVLINDKQTKLQFMTLFSQMRAHTKNINS